MAIQKSTDVGDTGMVADHWALCDLQLHRGEEAGTTKCVGSYRLWMNAAAYAAGKQPVRRGRKITVIVPGTDPKVSEIALAFDKELIRKEVKGVRAVAAVTAVKGVTGVAAKAAVKADAKNGIKAKGAVAAVAAVVEVKAVAAVAAVTPVKGAELAGGAIV